MRGVEVNVGVNGNGTMTVADDAVVRSSSRLRVGSNGGSVGTLNQSGGDIYTGDWTTFGTSAGSTGTVTMTGGNFTVDNQWLIIGDWGTGSMDVSGVSTVQVLAGNFTMGQNCRFRRHGDPVRRTDPVIGQLGNRARR